MKLLIVLVGILSLGVKFGFSQDGISDTVDYPLEGVTVVNNFSYKNVFPNFEVAISPINFGTMNASYLGYNVRSNVRFWRMKGEVYGNGAYGNFLISQRNSSEAPLSFDWGVYTSFDLLKNSLRRRAEVKFYFKDSGYEKKAKVRSYQEAQFRVGPLVGLNKMRYQSPNLQVASHPGVLGNYAEVNTTSLSLGFNMDMGLKYATKANYKKLTTKRRTSVQFMVLYALSQNPDFLGTDNDYSEVVEKVIRENNFGWMLRYNGAFLKKNKSWGLSYGAYVGKYPSLIRIKHPEYNVNSNYASIEFVIGTHFGIVFGK